MNIRARVSNTESAHTVEVATDGQRQLLPIAPTAAGRGSSVSGRELLLAAVATSFSDDVHREALKRNIKLERVDVEVRGTFDLPGAPASQIRYRVRIQSDAPPSAIDELIRATDALAEVQRTLRAGCDVRLLTPDDA